MSKGNGALWAWWEKLCFKSFSSAGRIKLYTRLARIMRQPKANLVRVVEDLHERALRRGALSRIDAEAVTLGAVLNDLQGGVKPSAAMARFAKPVELMLIRGGEQSSDEEEDAVSRSGLQQAFEKCVALDTKEKRGKQAVRKAQWKLALYLMATIVALMVFALYVVPKIAIAYPPEQWQGIAASLYVISEIVKTPAALTGIGVVSLVIIIAPATFPYWTGPVRDALDKAPPFSFYRLQQGSGWLMSISPLTESGRLKAYDAVKLTAQFAQPWLKKHVRQIEVRMGAGQRFGQALVSAGGFPDQEVVNDIRLYEKQGLDVDEIVKQIAEDWSETGVELIEKQAAILQGAAFGLFALVVIWFTLGTVLLQVQMPAYFMSQTGF